MKLLQNKFIILISLVVFILMLIGLYYRGCKLGISQSETHTIIVNALLMLLATFISISLPLYATSESERQKKDDELKNTYISVSRYVGAELADNIIRIEDIVLNNDKTIADLDKKNPNMTQSQKGYQQVNIWRLASEEILIGLENIYHKSLVMSGILTKVPDNKMNSEIKDSYSKMANLKQRLRRLSIFCRQILSPPSNSPSQIIEEILVSQVPASIKIAKEDIDIFLKQAKVAIKEINETIKPYGKEVKIETYYPQE